MTIKSIDLQPSGSHKVRIEEDVSRKASTIDTSQTTVTTTPTKIATPVDATDIRIKHMATDQTLWIGGSANITAAGTDVYPLRHNETLVLDQMLADNENSIYAVVESGSVTVYCLGRHLE